MTALPLYEPTEAGEQMLISGVAPMTLRERLLARAAAPLQPTKLQRPLDFGLFDMAARNQLELFATNFRAHADEGSHQSSTLMGPDVAAVCRRTQAGPETGSREIGTGTPSEGALP